MDISNQRNSYMAITLLGISPFLVNGLVNSMIYQTPFLYWGFELLVWVLIPLLVVYYTTKISGFRFSDLGFHKSVMKYPNIAILVLASSLFAPICYWIYTGSVRIFSGIFSEHGFFQYGSVVPTIGVMRFIVVGYFAISAGLVEEFLFRGMVFKVASCFQNSAIIYLTASPILFSLVHWENGAVNLFSTYIFGIFMSVSFLVIRNIWPLIVGHTFTDLMLFSQ